MAKHTEENLVLNNNTKYFAFVLLFLFITVASFFVIYQLVSDRSLVLSLKIFSNLLFVKMIGLMLVYLMLDALRLYYVLKAIGVSVQYRYIFKLVFINIFISNVTPFATGGGFAQVYFLNKKGVSVGDASAASLIRTFLAIAFMMLTAPIIVMIDLKILNIYPNAFSIVQILLGLGFYSAIILGIYNLIMKPKFIEKLVHKVLMVLKNKKIIGEKKATHYIEKTDQEIEKLSKNIKNYLKGNKKYVFLSIAFTTLFLVSLFSFSVVLIKDLNPGASGLKIFFSQLIITALMYLAPTPGATGVAEGAFTLMFLRFVSKRNILSLIFSWRLFSIYIPMVIGMIIFYIYVFLKRKIQKEKGVNTNE